MGLRSNHIKYEPETQRWRPGMGILSAGPPFQNLQFGVKISGFLPKTAVEPPRNSQMWEMVATLHMQLPFPRTAPERPPKAPKFVHIGHRQPQTPVLLAHLSFLNRGSHLLLCTDLLKICCVVVDTACKSLSPPTKVRHRKAPTGSRRDSGALGRHETPAR